jgi:hypothetical protein
MKPTDNDVLSGRGAGFNQRPGNERFRRIIEEQKVRRKSPNVPCPKLVNFADAYLSTTRITNCSTQYRMSPFHLPKAVYIKGTKKQKMNMSNAIVESIYSMEPPGRFLKQCPDTGQWSELSKREAADRVAQAMTYAVRGKEKLKQKKEERRRSRSSSRQKSKDDAAAAKSSQSADRPARLRSHATNNNNQLEDSGSSSAARHGVVARGGGAVGMNNNVQSASSVLLHPDNSSLQQQLLIRQLLQSSSTTLPTSSGSPIIDQSGLARLLVQTLQQQQLQQQYLPLQHTLGEDSLGIQTQTPLQPALLEGLAQLLNQTWQQQQRSEQQQQQQLLLQRLLNQPTVVPSTTLLPTLSLSAPFLTGPRSHPATSNLLQNQVHLQSNPSDALFLSVLRNVGISNAPQGSQQMEQLQRSLMLQQQQILASSLGASSNDRLAFQQQQSHQLDLLLREAALQLQQNSQGLLPPPKMLLLNRLGRSKAKIECTVDQMTTVYLLLNFMS